MLASYYLKKNQQQLFVIQLRCTTIAVFFLILNSYNLKKFSYGIFNQSRCAMMPKRQTSIFCVKNCLTYRILYKKFRKKAK